MNSCKCSARAILGCHAQTQGRFWKIKPIVYKNKYRLKISYSGEEGFQTQTCQQRPLKSLKRQILQFFRS